MDRRTFIKLAAAASAGVAFPGCSDKLLDIIAKGDEKVWGMNVHAYSGSSRLNLQVRALEALGINRIRITLGLGRDLASPYIGAYPAEYVGIVGDYTLAGLTAARWPDLVRGVMSRRLGVDFYEILNEPDIWPGIPAATYVNDYLRPAFEIIRERDPGAKVVAAAPRGTSAGQAYFYEMTRAGAGDFCDFRAVHIYTGGSEVFRLNTPGPFMVTESGSSDPQRHVKWWSEEMPHISQVLHTDRLYWYALMVDPPDGHNVIATTGDARGNPRPASPLYAHILAQQAG